MNLWIVDNRFYVIADGPAGAAYLAKGEKPELIKRKIESTFNPRRISAKEAKQYETI